MHELEERMTIMEIGFQRETKVGGVSLEEEEFLEEEAVEEPTEAKVLKPVSRYVMKPKPYLTSYTRSMNPK